MTTPISLSAEWLAPGSVAIVSASVEASLAEQGGKVQGLDADFGNALTFRLVGSLFSGHEDELPLHIHVDIRPGPAEAQSLVRAEMRSTEGWYLFKLSQVDAQYRERFDGICSALRTATGVASS